MLTNYEYSYAGEYQVRVPLLPGPLVVLSFALPEQRSRYSALVQRGALHDLLPSPPPRLTPPNHSSRATIAPGDGEDCSQGVQMALMALTSSQGRSVLRTMHPYLVWAPY